MQRPFATPSSMRIGLTLAAIAASALWQQANAGTSIEERRSIFREVYADAERGDWGPAEAAEDVLAEYPLWPDLRATWLQARLSSAESAEIFAFLRTHGDLPPAVRLRGKWIYELARRRDWAAFIEIYDSHYAEAGIVKLDCIAANARARLDAAYRLPEQLADRLWLVGHSQPRECDPVFSRMEDQGQLTEAHYRRRFDLAIEAREFRLARYLARELDPKAGEQAKAWIDMKRDPANELVRVQTSSGSRDLIERVSYGIRLLARRDPAYAARLWQRLAEKLGVDGRQRWALAGYIGVRAAVSRDPSAAGLLKAIPLHLADQDTLAWRVRNALLREDWDDALATVKAMPSEQAGEDVWRYWLARSLEAIGDSEQAEPIYAALSSERSYHGFMAADTLELPYAFGHIPIEADERAIAALADDPAIRRAGELFHVGLESQGRSEWNAATEGLDPRLRVQAAVLAHRWGWHSRAIAMAARAGHYDDLDLRYPLPWKETFEAQAAAANIREAWALGIARSESLFMTDVRSRAGAIGVMQLMPTTGRAVAREARLPYRGASTLIDPFANIQLGTRYLGSVYERFASNPVLATAAYNAGPHRVEKWLPDRGSLAADIWIETIPFAETRSYVKRVLTADSIFSWRLTGQEHRLSALHPPVSPAEQRLASAVGR